MAVDRCFVRTSVFESPVPGIDTVRLTFPSAPTPILRPGTPTDAPTPFFDKLIRKKRPKVNDFLNLQPTCTPSHGNSTPNSFTSTTASTRAYHGALSTPAKASTQHRPRRALRHHPGIYSVSNRSAAVPAPSDLTQPPGADYLAGPSPLLPPSGSRPSNSNTSRK